MIENNGTSLAENFWTWDSRILLVDIPEDVFFWKVLTFTSNTLEWGDLDLFLVYFMISYVTATIQLLDIQNVWHWVLTLLIKKHVILDHPCF